MSDLISAAEYRLAKDLNQAMLDYAALQAKVEAKDVEIDEWHDAYKKLEIKADRLVEALEYCKDKRPYFEDKAAQAIADHRGKP